MSLWGRRVDNWFNNHTRSSDGPKDYNDLGRQLLAVAAVCVFVVLLVVVLNGDF